MTVWGREGKHVAYKSQTVAIRFKHTGASYGVYIAWLLHVTIEYCSCTFPAVRLGRGIDQVV